MSLLNEDKARTLLSAGGAAGYADANCIVRFLVAAWPSRRIALAFEAQPQALLPVSPQRTPSPPPKAASATSTPARRALQLPISGIKRERDVEKEEGAPEPATPPHPTPQRAQQKRFINGGFTSSLRASAWLVLAAALLGLLSSSANAQSCDVSCSPARLLRGRFAECALACRGIPETEITASVEVPADAARVGNVWPFGATQPASFTVTGAELGSLYKFYARVSDSTTRTSFSIEVRYPTGGSVIGSGTVGVIGILTTTPTNILCQPQNKSISRIRRTAALNSPGSVPVTCSSELTFVGLQNLLVSDFSISTSQTQLSFGNVEISETGVKFDISAPSSYTAAAASDLTVVFAPGTALVPGVLGVFPAQSPVLARGQIQVLDFSGANLVCPTRAWRNGSVRCLATATVALGSLLSTDFAVAAIDHTTRPYAFGNAAVPEVGGTSRLAVSVQLAVDAAVATSCPGGAACMEISLNWFSNATYGVQDSAFIASSRIDALLDLTIEIKTSRVRRGGSVKCELIGNAIQSDIEVSGAIDSSFGVLESTSPTTLTVLVSPSASRGAIEYNFRWTKSVDEKQSTIVPTPVSRTHVIDAVFSCRASRLRYGASTVCGAAADGKTFFPGDLQAGDFDSNLNRPVPDVGALAMTNDSSFTFAYTYTAPIASTATSTASLTALSLSWASAVGSGPVLTATRSSSFPVSLVDLQQSIFSCPSSRVRPGGTVLCTLSGTPVGNLNASDFQGIVTEDVTAGTFAPTRLGSFTSTTAVFVLPFTASSVRQSGSFRVSAVWNRTAVGGSANVRVSGTLQSALFLIGATFACTPEAGRVRRSDLIRCTMTAITLNPNDQALQPGDLAETLSITPPEAGTSSPVSLSSSGTTSLATANISLSTSSTFSNISITPMWTGVIGAGTHPSSVDYEIFDIAAGSIACDVFRLQRGQSVKCRLELSTVGSLRAADLRLVVSEFISDLVLSDSMNFTVTVPSSFQASNFTLALRWADNSLTPVPERIFTIIGGDTSGSQLMCPRRVRRGTNITCAVQLGPALGMVISEDLAVRVDGQVVTARWLSPVGLTLNFTVLISPSLSTPETSIGVEWAFASPSASSALSLSTSLTIFDVIPACGSGVVRRGVAFSCIVSPAQGFSLENGDIIGLKSASSATLVNSTSFQQGVFSAVVVTSSTASSPSTGLVLEFSSTVGGGTIAIPLRLYDLVDGSLTCTPARLRRGLTATCKLLGSVFGNITLDLLSASSSSSSLSLSPLVSPSGFLAPGPLQSDALSFNATALPSATDGSPVILSVKWNGGSEGWRVELPILDLENISLDCLRRRLPYGGRMRCFVKGTAVLSFLPSDLLAVVDGGPSFGTAGSISGAAPPYTVDFLHNPLGPASTSLSLSVRWKDSSTVPVASVNASIIAARVSLGPQPSCRERSSPASSLIRLSFQHPYASFNPSDGSLLSALTSAIVGAPAQLRVNQSRLAVIKSFPTAAGRVGVEIEVSPTSDDQDPPSVVEAVLTTLGPYFSGNWLGSTFPEPLFFANDSGPYSCGGGQPIVFSHILFPVVVQRSLPPWTEAALEDFKPFLLGPGLQLVAPLTAAPDNTLVATLQALPWNPALTQSNVTLLYTAGDSTLHVDVTRDTVPPGTLHLALGAAPSPSPTPDRPPPSETSALLSLTIDIPYNSISSSFETFVLDRVFKNLNQGSTKVSRNRLIIQSIRPGSVIVVVEILASAASGETSPSQVLSQLKTPLPTSWLSPQLPLKSSSITINTPPAPSPLPGSSGTSDGLSAGAIAGIVIGSIAGFFLLVGVACWVYFGLLAKPVPAFLAPVHNLFKPLTEYSLYWDGYIPKLRRLRQIPPPTEPQKSRAGSFADTMAAAKPRASPTGSASAGSGSLVVELEFSGCRDADVRSRQWEIPGAAIVVFDRKGNEEQRKKGRQLSTRVEFTGLLPGEKNVEVMAKAVTIVSSQVRVAAGAERVESIELEKVPLVVRVLNPDGSPASGLALSLSPATGARVDGMDETDAAGDVLFLVDPAALGDGHGSVTALRNGKTLAKFEDAEELFPFSLSIFNLPGDNEAIPRTPLRRTSAAASSTRKGSAAAAAEPADVTIELLNSTRRQRPSVQKESMSESETSGARKPGGTAKTGDSRVGAQAKKKTDENASRTPSSSRPEVPGTEVGQRKKKKPATAAVSSDDDASIPTSGSDDDANEETQLTRSAARRSKPALRTPGRMGDQVSDGTDAEEGTRKKTGPRRPQGREPESRTPKPKPRGLSSARKGVPKPSEDSDLL